MAISRKRVARWRKRLRGRWHCAADEGLVEHAFSVRDSELFPGGEVIECVNCHLRVEFYGEDAGDGRQPRSIGYVKADLDGRIYVSTRSHKDLMLQIEGVRVRGPDARYDEAVELWLACGSQVRHLDSETARRVRRAELRLRAVRL